MQHQHVKPFKTQCDFCKLLWNVTYALHLKKYINYTYSMYGSKERCAQTSLPFKIYDFTCLHRSGCDNLYGYTVRLFDKTFQNSYKESTCMPDIHLSNMCGCCYTPTQAQAQDQCSCADRRTKYLQFCKQYVEFINTKGKGTILIVSGQFICILQSCLNSEYVLKKLHCSIK